MHQVEDGLRRPAPSTRWCLSEQRAPGVRGVDGVSRPPSHAANGKKGEKKIGEESSPV